MASIGLLVSVRENGGEPERYREILTTTESKSTVKQFERVLRQNDRLEFVGEVLNSGYAADPDDGRVISIPDPVIILDHWHQMLLDLLEASKEKSWAYDVQGAMFMGAYRGEPWARTGHVMFLVALGLAGDVEKDYRIIRLADCMKVPLALPIFSLPINPEDMFDLLFGRLNVCVAVSIPGMIQEALRSGLGARPATRKELAEARRHDVGPVMFDGTGVMFTLDDKKMMLVDGIILRALFHQQRPVSVIRSYLENQDLLVREQPTDDDAGDQSD